MPATPGELEAVTDLDPLDRLDPHQREREARVEPVGLLGVRAEPRWAAGHDDLDDAAERVAILPRLVGDLAHAVVGGGAADLDRTPGNGDPESRQQGLRDGTRGDVCGRVAGAGALERVADVVVVVLEDACEVGMTRPSGASPS